MSAHVTAENYQATLAGLWALTSLVEEAPLDEMIRAAEYADTVGVVVDPTLYRQKATALHEDLEMLRALQHVQSVMAHLRARKVVVEQRWAGGAA